MTAPAPRRRFQLHLSTAVVNMFVLGGLLFANMHPEETEKRLYPIDALEDAKSSQLYGWPIIAYRNYDTYFYERSENGSGFQGYPTLVGPGIFAWPLLADVGVALVAVICTTTLMESLARRREVRKP